MTKFTKTKAQMKSSSYYLFWGIATLAVVAGYRSMSESIEKLVNAYVNRPRTMPADKPSTYQMPIIR